MGQDVTQHSSVEIIPSGELKGIELALREMDDDLAVLPELKIKAEQIEVTDQSSFLEAGLIQTQVEKIGGKDGGSRLAPFFDIANTVINFLRTKRTTVQTKKQEIVNILNKKRNDWAQKEREAAAREQAELNKKNQRSGAPAQSVLPNIPTTAGKRKTTTYPIEVRDMDKFINHFKKATGAEAKFLRQFIILDTPKVAQAAREMQDPKAFMKRFPGIYNEKKESV